MTHKKLNYRLTLTIVIWLVDSLSLFFSVWFNWNFESIMNVQFAVDLMLYSSYLYFYLVNIKRLKCMFEQKCAFDAWIIDNDVRKNSHTHTHPIDIHSFYSYTAKHTKLPITHQILKYSSHALTTSNTHSLT